MRRVRGWIAACACALVATRAAAAQREMVTLRDGSSVEGALVEYAEGDHVTLRLDDGTERRFDWLDIDSARQAPTDGAARGLVVLQDGTVLRGRVIESVAGDHVLIRLEGGEVRRVLWESVATVAMGARTSGPMNDAPLAGERVDPVAPTSGGLID